ncbi:MAG: peptide ABC transporter substrate-binding protein [Vulcanimicrobiaceae bacterium]
MRNFLAIVLAAAFVAGCTKVGTQTGQTGERQNSFTVAHTLRYATAEDLVGLNPHLNQQTTLFLMASLTMAWLIKFDHNNRPVPELALQIPTKANGGISADGKTITYHLRKGVKWSDGAPFNADDVVFSTGVVLNSANNEVSRTGWDLITKTDEPDKYTVVYHLKQPYASFFVTFFSSGGANPCILPKHLLAGLPNINSAPYNALPVGIGPFKYKEWKRGDQVVMVANPLYFRGRPKLNKVVWKSIPDRNTVATQIQGSELDMWYPVPGSYFDRVKSVAGYTYIRQPSYYFNHMDFNLSSPKLRDPAVRQALRLAVDRPTLREKIGHGVGILQESPISPAAPYAVPKIATIPFDIAKANELLDRAGWKRGADGIRQKDGVKLIFNYATSTGSQDVDQQLELIRTWWKQIGADMQVHHYLSSLLFAPYQNGGIIYAGKFDIVNFSWGLDPLGDLSVLYACDQIPPKGQNDPRWCNKKADEAMAKAKVLYDEKERQPYENAAVSQLINDAPTIVTSVREDIWVHNKDLKNFAPNQVSPFDDFMNVDI